MTFPPEVVEQVQRWYEEGASDREITRRCHAARIEIGRTSVQRIIRLHKMRSGTGVAAAPDPEPVLPDPAPEAGGPDLPAPCVSEYEPVRLPDAGKWLLLGDVHIPYHDPGTIRAAVAEGKRQGVTGVLLNGDVLDFYQISRFSRDPSKPRMKVEIEKGREFLAWLRSQFPRARIVFKEGNHDERLRTYLAERAPELFDLDDLQLVNLLRAADRGVEWVADKRVVTLGKLLVVHGHEYPGGGGVNPARWLFLRTGASSLCAHFHQPSYHPFRTADQREQGVWSIGCSCFLHPAYRPLNQWLNGFAVVTVEPGGHFRVDNRTVLSGGRVA